MDIEIGLSAKARKGVAEILHAALADAHVLYIKTRKYHWDVSGRQFSELHPFLESQYKALEESIDAIAERSLMIGVKSPGAMATFLKLARLKECTGAPDAMEMLKNLKDDHEAVVRQLRKDIDVCTDDLKDAGTADFLTGIMEAHEKMAWMLRAHLD